MDAGLRGGSIPSSKQIIVVKLVIKVVKNLADLEARVERINCFVSLVEWCGKSPEHVGEGQIGFPVPVIASRVVKERRTLFVHSCVSAP